MSFIWKFMIVGSFAMLSTLTWGSSPLQKVFEKVQRKEQVIATVRVCREIRASISIYENYFQDMFRSGCMWEIKNTMFLIYQDEAKREEVRSWFKKDETPEWDKFYNHCSEGSANYLQEGKLKDIVLSPIYHDQLNCPAMEEEAKKLGIKEEDLDERDKNKK